jgi:hypothetical protein
VLEGSNGMASSNPSRLRRWVWIAAILVATYFATSYLLAPEAWNSYGRHHPTLEDIPTITYTHSGIHGDPLNVALIGTETQLKTLMIAAKWYPADPLTLKSCLKIAEATVLKRPYDAAPVSNLYLWDRKEDLAFELPVGKDPRKRNHVRFWRSDKADVGGQPIWVGSATYDERVGLSHTTGQITHHIAPDIDTERDRLIHDWQQTGLLIDVYTIDDFQKPREGRNGGGDPWHTDGNMLVGVMPQP